MAHRAGVADDAPRPVERPLALGREALEAGATLHQHHAEKFFQLFEARRHRRLGDAARLGRPPEMPLLGERQQKFKLVDQELRPFENSLSRFDKYHGCRSNNTPKAPLARVFLTLIAF